MITFSHIKARTISGRRPGIHVANANRKDDLIAEIVSQVLQRGDGL